MLLAKNTRNVIGAFFFSQLYTRFRGKKSKQSQKESNLYDLRLVIVQILQKYNISG